MTDDDCDGMACVSGKCSGVNWTRVFMIAGVTVAVIVVIAILSVCAAIFKKRRAVVGIHMEFVELYIDTNYPSQFTDWRIESNRKKSRYDDNYWNYTQNIFFLEKSSKSLTSLISECIVEYSCLFNNMI